MLFGVSRSSVVALCLGACLLVAGCAAAQWSPGSIGSVGARPDVVQSGSGEHWEIFPATPTQSGPFGDTLGPDENVWFADETNNSIDRIDEAGTITVFPLPDQSSPRGPRQITIGPDGALWFTEEYGGMIGRITTSGGIMEYPVPRPTSAPEYLTKGPDGDVWFTESIGDTIGRISMSGRIKEYPLPNPAEFPQGIVTGPDHNLWFAEWGGRIGRITTKGGLTEFPTNATSFGIISPGDGNLYYDDFSDDAVGQITTAGQVTIYPIPGGGRAPYAIARGPGDWLWLSQDDAAGVASVERFNFKTKQFMAPLLLPTQTDQGPVGIVEGADGNMWMTDFKFGTFGGHSIDVYVINPLAAKPTFLTLSPGLTSPEKVVERRYSGSFSAATSDPSVATVAPGPEKGVFEVTGIATGSCTITVSDAKGNSVPIPVTVR